MKYLILIIILIQLYYKSVEHFSNDKPIIWTYWENIPGKKRPAYVDLCFDTMKKHCSKNFNIKILNDKTIKNYLPNINPDINNLDKKDLCKYVDYYRLLLLYNYGGIWLDADTIVFKDLIPIIKKLKDPNITLVGFGCSTMSINNKCKRTMPSNGVMAAKKGCPIIKKYIEKCDYKLKHKKDLNDYYAMGKYLLWESINEVNKGFYLFDLRYDNQINFGGGWFSPKHHVMKHKLKLIDKKRILFTYLYNSNYSNEIRKMSKSDILKSDMIMSQMFRLSLE